LDPGNFRSKNVGPKCPDVSDMGGFEVPRDTSDLGPKCLMTLTLLTRSLAR